MKQTLIVDTNSSNTRRPINIIKTKREFYHQKANCSMDLMIIRQACYLEALKRHHKTKVRKQGKS